MSEISLSKIEKAFGARKIHDKISLDISKTDCIGLIGRNGSGKTTIFKMITGEEKPDEGAVVIRKGARIGCLDQVSAFPDLYLVKDVLNEPFTEILKLQENLNLLQNEIADSTGTEQEILLHRYGALEHQFESLDGYIIEDKIKKICIGLKISNQWLDRYFCTLSGGEQTIVMLARILLENPDVLLLDEPTNHLDIEAVEWLEEYLKNYVGGIVIISHDRYFLDRVTNKTVEIENCHLSFTNGNYSTHLLEKEKLALFDQRTYDLQQKEIKDLEESIRVTQALGKKQRNVGLLRKAIVMQDKLDRIVRLPKPQTVRNIRLNFKESSKSSTIIVRIRQLHHAFAEKTIFNDLDFLVCKNERVALLGRNGSGKSTLIKTILGQLKPDKGDIYVGEGAKIGYLDQEIVFEEEGVNLLNYLLFHHGLNEYQARSLLATFLFFKDDVTKSVSALSGGERTRLKLATLMIQNINTLILDEPTNHLDIDSREILEEAVSNFGGTLIFISHDRYFINKMAERVVALENQQLTDYEGNYEVYKNKINFDKEKLQSVKSYKVQVIQQKTVEIQKQNEEKQNRKKAAELESKIELLESLISGINQEIEESKTNYEKVNNLFYKRVKIEADRDNLLEQWCAMQAG